MFFFVMWSHGVKRLLKGLMGSKHVFTIAN